MALARAFIDLHHLTTPTAYYGDDFQLIVDDGNGNPVWANGVGAGGNGSIDETTYTDFQTGVNGENTVSRQAIAAGNNGPFGGFDNRGLIDLSNGYLKTPQPRIAYTIMDNSSGVVDPSAYVQDPSAHNLIAFRYDRTMVPPDNKGWYEGYAIVGGMFCTSQGKPKIVTIDGSDILFFGTRLGSENYANAYPSFFSPVTYPASPTNPTDSNNYYQISYNHTTLSNMHHKCVDSVFECQFDLTAGTGIIFEDGSMDDTTYEDLASNYPSLLSALRNNYMMPVFFGLNGDDRGYDFRVDDIGFKMYSI